MYPVPTNTEQEMLCAKYGAEYCECAPNERAGVALATLDKSPVYGVRTKNADGSMSWYIWAGPHSTAPDFFQPLCAGHLGEILPMVMRYLALPPGFKFIIDRSGYEDVWQEKEWANQRPDGTPAKSPPSNPGQVSGVPHP